jgi:hypothetical protein
MVIGSIARAVMLLGALWGDRAAEPGLKSGGLEDGGDRSLGNATATQLTA